MPSQLPNKWPTVAAIVFGLLALGAGALQAWAFVVSGQPRHAVFAVFALSVGACVVIAAAVH